MPRNKSLCAWVLVPILSLFITGAFAADTIKKCKDATGRWHYGDTAAEECATSKITVMSDQGTTKKVIDAPPTEAELKQIEAQREVDAEKQKQATEQAKKDALLLSTYGGEDDITYIRDRKIAQIETSIKASEETLKSLNAALSRMEKQETDDAKTGKADEDKSGAKNIEQTKIQIARHETLIAEKRKEQDVLRQQYADELTRYRELKKQQSTKVAPTAVKPH